MNIKKFTQIMLALVLAITIVTGVKYVSALVTWTPPTATPPGNNTDQPINTGASVQSKAGGLSLGGELTTSAGTNLLTTSGFSTNVLTTIGNVNLVADHGIDNVIYYDNKITGTGIQTGVIKNSNGLFTSYANTLNSAGLTTIGLKLTTGAGAGRILTSDASGNASWQAPAANVWTTSGTTLYNSTSVVGIGTNIVQSGMRLSVSGPISANSYCDSNGLNCFSTTQSGQIQCPPRRVMVDESSAGSDEWAMYGSCDNTTYPGFVVLASPTICDNNTSTCRSIWQSSSYGDYTAPDAFCREFGLKSSYRRISSTDAGDADGKTTFTSTGVTVLEKITSYPGIWSPYTTKAGELYDTNIGCVK